MPKRLNPHGEASLNPADYSYVHFFDANPFLGMMVTNEEWLKTVLAEIDAWKQRLVAESTSVYGKVHQCAHCGNHIRYHVIYRHLPTGALVAIGQDCAENRFDKSPLEWADRKAELDAMREAARQGERQHKNRQDFPEAWEVVDAYNAAHTALMDALDIRWEENQAAEARGERGRGNSDLWREFNAGWPSFIGDVAHRAVRYGLSEKQAAAVVKARAQALERIAEREAERADAQPCPDGRVQVEGVVLSAKWRDNAWGGSTKIVVKTDDGWKVWGTEPRAFVEWATETPHGRDIVGQRVSFTAAITPSDDDPSFGFFKRPTKAQVLGG